jgi:hypothetical protein
MSGPTCNRQAEPGREPLGKGRRGSWPTLASRMPFPAPGRAVRCDGGGPGSRGATAIPARNRASWRRGQQGWRRQASTPTSDGEHSLNRAPQMLRQLRVAIGGHAQLSSKPGVADHAGAGRRPVGRWNLEHDEAKPRMEKAAHVGSGGEVAPGRSPCEPSAALHRLWRGIGIAFGVRAVTRAHNTAPTAA